MTEGSRFMLYLLFGILGLFLAGVFLSLGPLGWVLLAFLLIGAIAYSSRGDDDRPERTNCADCGAPNPTDRETCEYCDASL